MSELNVIARGRSVWHRVVLALALGSCFVFGSRAFAASSDTITLSVTPGNITYGVTITSPEVQGYDFASVALGLTTISTKPIPVANSGNVSEYFALSVSNSTPDTWTPINSGIPGHNQFKMLGRFVASGGGQPASSSFDVNLDTVTTSVPAAAAGRYGQAAKTIPGNSTDLYLQLIMPQSITSPAQQHMTVTINGQGS